MKKLSIIKQMLKATLLTILVVFNSYDLYSQTQLEDAQDATLTDLHTLPEGVYFEIQQFEDGSILTKKLFNKHQ